VTTVLDVNHTHTHGLLRALAYLYGCEQTIISIGMARRWVMRRLSWSTGQVFDEIRNRIAPQRLVDKSAVYSRNAKCLERIRKISPDAYYVYVIEHPLTSGAVSASARRGAEANAADHRTDAEVSQHDQMRWLQAQRLITDAVKGVAAERFAVLRLESLMSETRSALTKLCTRLDLPSDEAAITEMLHPERSPFAGVGPVGANLGDDRTFLRDPTFPPKFVPSPPGEGLNRKEMLPEVAQFAGQYGYD